MKKLFVFLFSFLLTLGLSAQSFFDVNAIQDIRIYFSQPNWDYQMDTAKWGAEGYLQADSIIINGEVLNLVGVKYKGNSSYDSTYAKNPLNIALDEYTNQDYQGVKTIKLSNQYLDPSMIREVLAYSILGNYMEVPKANFASLYINDVWTGLYTNTETIDKSFCAEHFQYSKGTFVKCNPILNPSPSTKSNLKFIDSDSSSYFNYYEMKSNSGWNELVGLCDSILNSPEALPQMLDMDRFIWMLAFDNAMVNLDSYLGVFAQNYYLYKDGTARFNPIVWDLNMCFGGFPYIGGGGTSMGALAISEMQNLSTNAHSSDAYWPVIKWIHNHSTYKKMYWAHLKTIVEEMIQSGVYLSMASQMQSLIDSMVSMDPHLFFNYTAFQSGMSASASSGTYLIPGIQDLMEARASFLGNTTEWNYSAPDIQPLTTASVQIGETITIQVVVGNANEVYLGFRFYSGDAFTRYLMWDDGQHSDESAGDGIFGVEIPMVSGQMQYYFYAQNGNAGIFSPARAEHEFYYLNAIFSTGGYPVLNECMASNIQGEANTFGDYSDWIELKNNFDFSIGLNGYFISDDISNLQKYAFKSEDFIEANGRLIVWGDDRMESGIPHCGFSIRSSGDSLYLSDSQGGIIDSVSFGSIPSDSSWARCPDGLGLWDLTGTTFDMANCQVVGIAAEKVESSIYPNPCENYINVNVAEFQLFNIFDAHGRLLLSGNLFPGTNEIEVKELSNGLYWLSINDKVKIILVQH